MWPKQQEGLNVIALISGGKDSFFSLLHCRANGHRIVALANLHPPLPARARVARDAAPDAPAAAASVLDITTTPAPALVSTDEGPGPTAILSGHDGGDQGNEQDKVQEDESDLNSFMYQTVGHQVIPLYAEATGIPLYRRAITGRATQGKDYNGHRLRPTTTTTTTTTGSGSGPGQSAGEAAEDDTDPDLDPGADEDETESMIPLLQVIMKAHPEANALCAGAVLSNYQRTRVESVALRLGLTPLAYLWKFPVLPRSPSYYAPFVPKDLIPAKGPGCGEQLLDDMAAAGLEARIVKVASGGLDESFLWTNVASPAGKARVERAMRRFGAGEDVGAAVIGEGGEFETLVVDGPPSLFKKRIVVKDEDMRVVREGGGSAWLSISRCSLEDKGVDENASEEQLRVRIPQIGDRKFGSIHARWVPDGVSDSEWEDEQEEIPELSDLQPGDMTRSSEPGPLQQWSFTSRGAATSIQEDTLSIVSQIRDRLRQHSLPSTAILSAAVLLRHMSDFPAVNAVYGTLFDAPNPASRVTVACGPALSAATSDASNIMVHLLVHTALPTAQRHGLHVQSRSYWAPANIGPYSQAIAFPISSLAAAGRRDSSGNIDTTSTAVGPRLVTIAGQIPLMSASMTFWPIVSSEDDAFHLTHSLNHLWRIGAEMGVQWWTSVVAYFPAEDKKDDYRPTMKWLVEAAELVWRLAHTLDDEEKEDDDEEEEGPDVWDRKFNHQYMTFASGQGKSGLGSGGAGAGAIPDWSVLAETDPTSPASKIVPPMFAAEVEELPRGAMVEWHAHFGIANAAEKSIVVREGRIVVDALDLSGTGTMAPRARNAGLWQVVVRSGQQQQQELEEREEEEEAASTPPPVSFVQTVVAQPYEDRHTCGGIRGVSMFADAALAQLEGGSTTGGEQKTKATPMVHVSFPKPPPPGPSINKNGKPANRQTPADKKEEEEDEEEVEDYMTMLIPDDPPSSSTGFGSRCETSLQRRLRLKREAEARSRPKSKAELEAEAEARRESALATSLFERAPRSKGLAIMARMGFSGGALGRKKDDEATAATPTSTSGEGGGDEVDEPKRGLGSGSGSKTKPAAAAPEPIKLHIRPDHDRSGIGLESERKRQLREAAESLPMEKRARTEEDPAAYRARVAREREEARMGRQVEAAQRVAERMARERDEEQQQGDGVGDGDGDGKLLRSIPVEWRGLVRAREEEERDKRMRHDLEHGLVSLSSSRGQGGLPGYDDPEEDEDDRRALGKDAPKTSHVVADDLDEEDPELDEFDALPVEDRLRRVVEHLRKEYRYCFWCKYRYPDEEMEGCPGLTEEEHD
ncbi:hypothetical protein VTJ49DRAFT_3229 [Mycothermus thermophilus]|uniref:Diphthine--ammonia ligase n=1 Tax=Humicola insolens TaxID=85995 RepID=A0ABR3V850_HUMIN